MTRGGSRRGKAATGRRAGAARPCQCSRHCDTCTDWPSPCPTSCKRGCPALRGQGTSLLGHTASRLCQRELLQALLPQPVPGEVLAGHHAHHLPGNGRGTAPCGHTEPGDSVALAPVGAQAAWTQGLTSLRLSTTTKCRRPRARKSLNTRGRDASCKAERGWGAAAAIPPSTSAPQAHPDPWGAVHRGPWPLPGAQCRARGS